MSEKRSNLGVSMTKARSLSFGKRARTISLTLIVSIGALGMWSAPALASSCPNEQVRLEDHSTELPDCRAYELVSPPYIDGYFPVFRSISPDGKRGLLESIGKFGGAEGNSAAEGTFYEAHRTSSDWGTKSIFPPASKFPLALFEDASLDLTHTLWTAHLTSQSSDAEDLYVREPNGSFVRIGPELPPAAEVAPPGPFSSEHSGNYGYRGASADLSHVLFQAEPEEDPEEVIVWPGDKTLAGRSIYEYDGVEKTEPKLVGVSNVGRFANNSEAQLITRCGVDLGGGGTTGGSTFNAISFPSGDRVFFTAHPGECENEVESANENPKVRELYVRIDEAETVDLSEPTTGPLGNCEECDESIPSKAVFEGASQDGTKAFFLSDQEGLLPGAKGINLYEYDFKASAHKKLMRILGGASEPKIQGVARISQDGSHVYFVAEGVLAGNENLNHEEAILGDDNLYVFDSITGATSFVARLSAEDQEDWQARDVRPVQATPDGRFMIFVSRSHLTPDDHSGSNVAQLFEYDAETGELVRISAGQRGKYFCPATAKLEEGFNCDGNTENSAYAPSLPVVQMTEEAKGIQTNESVRVSPDGGTVVFSSADPLAPQAANSLSNKLCTNVYEFNWNSDGGGITAGNVFLVSNGQDVGVTRGRCGTEVFGMDPSATDILLGSTVQLVARDTNTQTDVYDARKDGGFPAPAESPKCVADECQGSLSLSPPLFGAESATQVGGGNLVPASKPAKIKKAVSLTRALKLVRALAVCRKEPKKMRKKCEVRVKKKYGSVKAPRLSGKQRR